MKIPSSNGIGCVIKWFRLTLAVIKGTLPFGSFCRNGTKEIGSINDDTVPITIDQRNPGDQTNTWIFLANVQRKMFL